MAELALLLKATAVLIVALVAVRLGRRQSAAVRSLMLACTFGLLVAVPLASLTLPARAITVPAASSLPFAREAITPVVPVADSPVTSTVAPGSSLGVTVPSTRVVLRLVWTTGAIAFIVPLIVGLVRVRRIRSKGRPWVNASLPSAVDVVLHDDVRVPITCGLRRPVIVLPADATRWSASDLRRVMLHEIEHVRRRDWPVQMAARVICAVYWFHPLVWIAWRQLCLESERACDDAVLHEEDGTAYAEQLVLLARRITKTDAMPLLSIAGRSHLSTRVAAMLAGDVARGRVRVATVSVLATAAVVAAVAIGPLQAAVRRQQPTAQSSRSQIAFESVSIVADTRDEDARRSTADRAVPCCVVRYSADGRMTGTNVDLVDLVVSAYGLYRWQVVNAPQWASGWVEPASSPGARRDAALENRRFDVRATAGRAASPEEMRQMLRTLLANRFGLSVHREYRVAKIYELVVEPGGHKLQAAGNRKYVASEDVWLRNDAKTWTATLNVEGMTMGQLARNLGSPLETLVVDRTGLSGAYRITAKWGSVPGTHEIFEAFPAQLGLRFRETTGPVEYLVVDRAQRPALDAR
jgi:uncharacterized protein (TIGR03435 family)